MEQLELYRTEAVEVPDKKMIVRQVGNNPAGEKGLTPGHRKSEGHGRPPKATEQAYLEAFKEVVGIEEYKAMIEKHLSKAIAGDFKAFQEIIRQAQGKPKEQIVIETPQLEALNRIQQMIKQTNAEV